MMNKLKYFALLFMVLCMASCDRDLLDSEEDYSLDLTKITFSEDYKTFQINGELFKDSLKYDLCDSLHTQLRVFACGDFKDTIPLRAIPKITSVRNIARTDFAKLDMQALVIVDRTMEQPLVDKARNAVTQLTHFLNNSDIYISFLDSRGKISDTSMLSQDMLSQDFVSSSIDGKDKYLYRGIYDKMLEATSADSPFTKQNHFILVISDGIVWDEDKPFDPDHFLYQQNLLSQAQLAGEECPVFYSLMNDEFDMPLDVNNTMKSVCERTSGACFDISDVDVIHQTICTAHYMPHVDYEFNLENPDKRVFRGEHIHLFFEAIQEGEVRMHTQIDYQKGNWFDPIIVNGLSKKDLVIRCICYGVLMILLAYLILQLLVPYIKNKIFEHKYIAEYTGKNMTIAGRQVPEVCYFCKSPFQEGDKIVGSCEHVMHEECWEENGYRCPEHGITCKEDTQYANPKKRFALSNAPYYLEWVLAALVANILRCILEHAIDSVTEMKILHFFENLFLSDELAEKTLDFCFRNPHDFGVYVMCIVGAIAFMCRRHEPVRKQWASILTRSLIGFVAGYFIIFLDILLCTLFEIRYYNDLVGVISFALILLSIYGISYFRTPIRLNLDRLMVVGVIIVASGYLILRNYYLDARELLFILFAILYVSIALSVAFDTRRVWHCFLRVEGTMKKIDIAMFKWFLARPEAAVTLGRSVDSTIQITWDAKNKIAPHQADIREHHGILCLFPIEEGVFDANDAPLPADKPYKLYHGTRFKIGEIIFTYLEKY